MNAEELKRGYDLARKSGDNARALEYARILTDMTQQTADPKSAGIEAMNETPRPTGGAGLVFLGRGFDNLAKGVDQVGSKLAEWAGVISPEQSAKFQETTKRERMAEEEPYEQLAEKYPASAVLGEFTGENAPFANIPVPKIGRVVQQGIGRMINPLFSEAPEAVMGATQAAIPYAESDEERESAMKGGAFFAPVTRRFTDFMATRANARRGRMEDPRLTELHATGREEGVPIRRGTPEQQQEAAREAAERRTTSRPLGDIQSEVSADIAGTMAQRKGDLRTGYDMMFDSVQGQGLNTSGIRTRVTQKLLKEEQKGSVASKKLMNEYNQWATMNPQYDLKDLHAFREDLVFRAGRTSNPTQSAELRELSDILGDEMYKEVDQIAPGYADTLRNMDKWQFEDVAKLEQIPAVAKAIGENPTPKTLYNYLTQNPGPEKKAIYDMLSPEGKDALVESMWNEAYLAGDPARGFTPGLTGQYLLKNAEAAKNFMDPDDHQAMYNFGKLMAHLSGEGRNLDNSILKLIRGAPFFKRAVTDAVRRSSFMYMLSKASPDIKPGSPKMETFYRGLLRSVAVSEEPSDLIAAEDEALGGFGSGAVQSISPIVKSTLDRVIPGA